MESLTSESRTTVNLQQSKFMSYNECSVICLFKFIVSNSQVDTQSTITLLLVKLTTGMTDIMALLGKNISGLNNETRTVGNDLSSCGGGACNLLPHIFTTFSDCSSDNGPFTCYIEMLENQYNDGTINLESKDIMDKA